MRRADIRGERPGAVAPPYAHGVDIDHVVGQRPQWRGLVEGAVRDGQPRLPPAIGERQRGRRYT
jgi:hypothetical protein